MFISHSYYENTQYKVKTLNILFMFCSQKKKNQLLKFEYKITNKPIPIREAECSGLGQTRIYIS